jgi:thioredoxin 1
MSKIIEVRDDNFESQVVQSELPVLVDFWAPWCGPCKMVGPIMEQLAAEYADRVKVVKVDTQQNQQVPQRLGVRSIPTVVLFHGDEVLDAFVGARPKVAYAKALDKTLKKLDKQRRKQEKKQAKQAQQQA